MQSLALVADESVLRLDACTHRTGCAAAGRSVTTSMCMRYFLHCSRPTLSLVDLGIARTVIAFAQDAREKCQELGGLVAATRRSRFRLQNASPPL